MWKKEESMKKQRFSLILGVVALVLALAGPSALAADKLVVKDGGGNTKFLVTDNGQVGINTLNPTSQIETSMDGGANSDIKMRVASSGGGVPVYYGMRAGGTLSAPSATPTGKGLFWLGAMGHDGTAWTTALTGLIGFWSTENWTNSAMGTDMRFFTTPNGSSSRAERVRISDSGNVGIGTTNPNYKLDVAGDINTTGDIRKNGVIYNNPDYVFEPDYKMMSFEELKNYLEEKRHLPNMPSTEEVRREGVKLFEQNRLLLEKLEEAYLYILKLEERISKLETNR